MAAVFLVTFIVLALLGAINSGHLVWNHYKHSKEPLACPFNHQCTDVTESKWASIFYIRNDTIGFLFYLAILVSAILMQFISALATTLPFYFVLATGGALLFSIFLIGVQVFAIKNYCFYCIVSALITLLIFINSFALS